jgi:hypothetical protein
MRNLFADNVPVNQNTINVCAEHGLREKQLNVSAPSTKIDALSVHIVSWKYHSINYFPMGDVKSVI